MSQSGTAIYVRVRGAGLKAGTQYPAHLHTLSCAEGGGGHCKIDKSIDAAVEGNALWPVVAAAADGLGSGSVGSQHIVRGEQSRSVVIHHSDPAEENTMKYSRLLGAACACLAKVVHAASLSSAVIDWSTFTITADGADVTSSVNWTYQADFVDSRYIEGAIRIQGGQQFKIQMMEKLRRERLLL